MFKGWDLCQPCVSNAGLAGFRPISWNNSRTHWRSPSTSAVLPIKRSGQPGAATWTKSRHPVDVSPARSGPPQREAQGVIRPGGGLAVSGNGTLRPLRMCQSKNASEARQERGLGLLVSGVPVSRGPFRRIGRDGQVVLRADGPGQEFFDELVADLLRSRVVVEVRELVIVASDVV
jgi:hypothetical protein